MRKLLDRPGWWEVPAINKALRPILRRLAARYLTTDDKRPRARPRGAFPSRQRRGGRAAELAGRHQRQRLQAVLRHDGELPLQAGDVDANHEAYAAGRIVASREVRALAKG